MEILISIWCLLLWIKTKDYGLIVDDVKIYQSPVSESLISRLHGSHTFDSTKEDRAVSIGLHWLMSVLVSFVNPIAGLMFAVHPSTMQVAVWLNGKRYAVCGILSMMAYLTPLAIPLLPLIFLFQPCGVPSLLFVFRHGNWWMIVPLMIAIPFLLTLFRYRLSIRAKHTSGVEIGIFSTRKVIFAIKSLWVYFRQSVLPEKNVMYYEDYYGITQDERPIYKLDYRFWFGLCALVFIALNIQNGWWMWLLFIFQWLNWITYTQLFADRYLYIALVGSCLYLSGTVLAWPLIGYYAARSWENTRQYEGFIQFLKYNNDVAPKNAESAIFLSNSYLSDGRFDLDALCVAKEALTMHPDSYLLNFQMGRCLERIRDYHGAYNFYSKSMSLLPASHSKDITVIKERMTEMQSLIHKEAA